MFMLPYCICICNDTDITIVFHGHGPMSAAKRAEGMQGELSPGSPTCRCRHLRSCSCLSSRLRRANAGTVRAIVHAAYAGSGCWISNVIAVHFKLFELGPQENQRARL
jgi:hypothetical protein